MADQKVTALVEELAPALTDVLYMVDDPSGSPTSKKVAIQSLLNVSNIIAFHATMSGDQTLSSGVEATIQFNTETFDVGGYYNNATYLWTPPAGYVLMYSLLYYSNVHTGGMYVRIRRNAAQIASNQLRLPNGVGPSGVSLATLAYTSAGTDTFSIRGLQYSGGNLDVTSGYSMFFGLLIPQS